MELVCLDIAGRMFGRRRRGDRTAILVYDAFSHRLQLVSIVPLIPLSPTHPLVQMFQVKTMNNLNSSTDNELGFCDKLLREDFFPKSLWIMSLRACVLYHMHGMSCILSLWTVF